MPTATVTSKGQITIPAPIRAALGLKAGAQVNFVEFEPGRYTMMTKTGSVKDLRGMIPKPAKPVSIEEMNRAIAEGASGTRP